MKIIRTIENKYASFSVLFWIWILSFWSLSAFSQSSTSLYVGDYTYFSAPNPPVSGAAISQTAWGSRHASVSVEKYMTYGAKVTVNSYFTDKAEIQCDYYYYTYVGGRQLGPYRATTYFYVTCKPVNINLNTSYMNLDVGEGEWLEYSLSPSISHKPTIRMYSSNTRVATVNSSGYVKAEGPGDCVITVENSAGPNATCSVHVNKVDPTDVSLSTPEPIYIGQKVTLTPWLYPDNAQTTFSWKSSDNSVAEVSNGVVTGKSVGTARITVTTANNLSASCNVEVYKPVPSRIELNKTTLRLPVGGKESLSYNVTPSYAIYSVTWESDASEIVSVNNGNLEAKSPGVANISVVTDNGKKSVCKVTVPPEPTAVSVKPESIELVVGKKQQLSYSYTPSDALTSSQTWMSSNNDIATVSNTGEVTAKAKGTAKITLVTRNGVSGSCDVTVFPAPHSISISESSLQLHVDDVATLSYSVLPTNAVYKITWKSSNTDVVSVNENGELKAKAQGSAKITVSTDNGLSSSCNVSVYPEPSSISLNKSTLSLIVGLSDSLTYSVIPTNALYNVSWSSSSPEVATVKNGRIEALKGGVAEIMVSTDNGKKAICMVNVQPEPTSVMLSSQEVEILIGRTKKLWYSFVPSNAATLFLSWKSSNPDVAFINQSGLVTALQPGHAKITAITRNGVEGKCDIIVPMPLYQLFIWSKSGIKTGFLSTEEPHFILKDSIVHFKTNNLQFNIHCDTLDKFTLERVLPEHPKLIHTSENILIGVGMSMQLEYNIIPENSKTTVSWFSDNEEVVSVTKDGLITAHKEGDANITIQTSNGLHAYCHVCVPKPNMRFFIWMKNGEVHSYDVEDSPEVTLGEEFFTLNTKCQTVQYEAANILHFTLQDQTVVDVTTDVENLKNTDEVLYDKDGLKLSNCLKNSQVYIYDTTGREIQSICVNNQGFVDISMASLKSGIYIIKTEKSTIKIKIK